MRSTPLSGSVVGGLVTSVLHVNLSELVTAIAAVRIGALTLAVGDIVGGNTFDVLFAAVADVLYRPGSVYHAIEPQTTFLLALTIVLSRGPRRRAHPPRPPRHRIRGGGDPRHLHGGGAEHPHPLTTWPLRPPPDGRPRHGTVGRGGRRFGDRFTVGGSRDDVGGRGARDGAERSARAPATVYQYVARSLFDVPGDPGGR